MIIYKDAYSGEELFTDSNKICTECDGEILRVTCREVEQEVGNDFDIGANASQEEQGEDLEKIVKKGIDIVLNQRLEEVTHDYTKKVYTTYLKNYLKKIATSMKAKGEASDGAKFQAAGNTLAKEVREKFDDIQFFRPTKDWEKDEGEEKEPFVIPLHRCPQTNAITMLFFKRGLVEEKV